MRWTQFADAQNQSQGGDVMGERCNEMHCIRLPCISICLFLRSINLLYFVLINAASWSNIVNATLPTQQCRVLHFA